MVKRKLKELKKKNLFYFSTVEEQDENNCVYEDGRLKKVHVLMETNPNSQESVELSKY